jgi:hypothetical protein
LRKLSKVIIIIMIAFILLSFCVYRLRLNRVLHTRTRSSTGQGADEKLKVAQGQISTVDLAARTFVLTDGNQSLIIFFDDSTSVSEPDHALRPDDVTAGVRATVKYRKAGGKNWAKTVLIASSGSEHQY